MTHGIWKLDLHEKETISFLDIMSHEFRTLIPPSRRLKWLKIDLFAYAKRCRGGPRCVAWYGIVTYIWLKSYGKMSGNIPCIEPQRVPYSLRLVFSFDGTDLADAWWGTWEVNGCLCSRLGGRGNMQLVGALGTLECQPVSVKWYFTLGMCLIWYVYPPEN